MVWCNTWTNKHKKTINEKGEEWVTQVFVGMNPEGFLWLCHLLEGAQNAHDAAFKDTPKDANLGCSITNFLEVMQNTVLKLDEDELPINPDAITAIIEHYRDTYGPYEGWNKFNRVVRTAHTAMKMRGKISASESIPMAGKSGCAGVVLFCVSSTIVLGYLGISLVQNL